MKLFESESEPSGHRGFIFLCDFSVTVPQLTVIIIIVKKKRITEFYRPSFFFICPYKAISFTITSLKQAATIFLAVSASLAQLSDTNYTFSPIMMR